MKSHKRAGEFGERLVMLLEQSGQSRHGAGAYLARRYKVSPVTANAWLNGEHMSDIETARRLAEDHGSTFDELYFGAVKGVRDTSASYLTDVLPIATPRSKARLTIYREKIERNEPLTIDEQRDLVRILKRLEALNDASQ